MKSVQSALAAGLLLAALPPAHAGELLTDDMLGEITAGSASAVYEDGRLRFDLDKTTGRGTRIGAFGDVNFDVDAVNTGILRLEDDAQGNLRALVNTNAVNSPVQVLINLNINVNSRVDVLNQVNSALQQK